MSSWLTGLVGVASVLMGGGGLAVLVNAFTGRRQRKAEVADRLSDSSLKWVQEFQEETQRARLEAAEARREVAEARRELGEVRHEAEALARDLRNIRGAIMAPNATLERLRAMVGGDTTNGRV
jgi:hypothetical protein